MDAGQPVIDHNLLAERIKRLSGFGIEELDGGFVITGDWLISMLINYPSSVKNLTQVSLVLVAPGITQDEALARIDRLGCRLLVNPRILRFYDIIRTESEILLEFTIRDNSRLICVRIALQVHASVPALLCSLAARVGDLVAVWDGRRLEMPHGHAVLGRREILFDPSLTSLEYASHLKYQNMCFGIVYPGHCGVVRVGGIEFSFAQGVCRLVTRITAVCNCAECGFHDTVLAAMGVPGYQRAVTAKRWSAVATLQPKVDVEAYQQICKAFESVEATIPTSGNTANYSSPRSLPRARSSPTGSPRGRTLRRGAERRSRSASCRWSRRCSLRSQSHSSRLRHN